MIAGGLVSKVMVTDAVEELPALSVDSLVRVLVPSVKLRCSVKLTPSTVPSNVIDGVLTKALSVG